MSVFVAIETSNPSAWTPDTPCRPGLAAGTPDGTPVGAEPIDPTARDDQIVQALDRLARRVGFGPRDIAALAVSVGPGGFTALRTAVAAAKLIAYGTGCRVIPVPSASVAAASTPESSWPLAVALASKSFDTYVTVLSAERDGEPGVLMDAAGLAALPARGVRTLLADHHLPAGLRRAAEAAGLVIRPPTFDPAACLGLAVTMPACDPDVLAPIYPREPEAVRKWRELGRSGRGFGSL